MSRRILMISYFFAPQATVGATRTVKFYEYLPLFGWEPYVLTVDTVDSQSGPALPQVMRTKYINPWHWHTKKTEQQLSSNKPTPTPSLREVSFKSPLRRKLYFLLRHVLPMSSVRMPDATLGWYPFAVRTGLSLLQSQKFDAIWSTTGPPTSHLVAAKLHSITGIPWVADYRDLWSGYYQEARLSLFTKLETKLERSVLSEAELLTTVSRGLAQNLSRLHQKPVQIIYNGYDDIASDNTPEQQTEFTIRYTGSLYPEKQDIRPLFEALARLRLCNPSVQLCIEFVGTERAWLVSLARTYNLEATIKFRGSVSREKATALQQSATALLLLGWNDDVMQPGVLPVKMFEYMRTGRPILEIGTDNSESAMILRHCHAGVSLQEPEAIQRILLAWWDEFQDKGKINWNTNMEQVTIFSRRTQTQKLAENLHNL